MFQSLQLISISNVKLWLSDDDAQFTLLLNLSFYIIMGNYNEHII